jgi:hypothetical protein
VSTRQTFTPGDAAPAKVSFSLCEALAERIERIERI